MNQFLQALSYLRQGDAVEQYAEALNELMTAVQATGKRGQLKIVLTIIRQGPGGPLKIDDKVECRPPAFETGSTFVFVDEDGNMTRRDPRQPDLPLRPVEHDEDGVITEEQENGTDG